MAAPTDNNIMLWNAVIFGPADTPFEDGSVVVVMMVLRCAMALF